MAGAFPGKKLMNVIGNHDGWPTDNTIPGIYEMMLSNISAHWSECAFFFGGRGQVSAPPLYTLDSTLNKARKKVTTRCKYSTLH